MDRADGSGLAPVPVGPVVWTQAVDLELKITSAANLGAGIDLTFSKVVTGGAHYSDGGWRVIRSHRDLSAGPGVDGLEDVGSASIGVELSARSVYSAKAYGVGGPKVAVGPYADVDVFALIPPRGHCTWDHRAHVGLDGTFGAEIEFLSFRLVDYEKTLFGGSLRLPPRDCPEVVDTTPPPSPEGLGFASVEQDRLVLTWDAVTDGRDGDIGYEVVRTSEEAGDRRTGNVAHNRFEEFNAIPDTRYCYVIHAVDGAGNLSGASQQECATTGVADHTAPTPPLGVVAEADSPSAIGLSWEDSVDEGAIAHYVVVDVSGDGQTDVGRTDDPSATVTGLVADTGYCFAILAVDETGNASEMSAEACAMTLTSGQDE